MQLHITRISLQKQLGFLVAPFVNPRTHRAVSSVDWLHTFAYSSRRPGAIMGSQASDRTEVKSGRLLINTKLRESYLVRRRLRRKHRWGHLPSYDFEQSQGQHCLLHFYPYRNPLRPVGLYMFPSTQRKPSIQFKRKLS